MTAIIVGVGAVAAAAGGVVEAGIVAGDPGQPVSYVFPGGFAWDDGIRAGQQVASVVPEDGETGWRMTTIAENGELTTTAARHQDALRRQLPVAVGSLVLAILAIGLLLSRHRAAAAFTTAAVLLATAPLDRAGDLYLSSFALAAAFALPVGWLAGWRRIHLIGRLAIAIGGLAVLAVWLAARFAGWSNYDAVNAFRNEVAFAIWVIILVSTVALPALRREFPSLNPLRVVDFLSLSLLAAACIALVVVLNASPLLVGGMLVAAIVIYPGWRRATSVAVDRLLLSDLRERAAIEATEEERARLARDIHDAPLQELAGVIRRLEVTPGLRAEGDTLRSVAGQLRAVATDLRPPVLDDLGLGAALSFLADRATTDDFSVDVDVDDETGITPEERAPAGVELALYRIAEEAVRNARLHSGGSAARIEGRIAPASIVLRVHDDGRGVTQAALDAAARKGRLGLASMRRRASLIGASFRLDSDDGGIVEVRWPR